MSVLGPSIVKLKCALIVNDANMMANALILAKPSGSVDTGGFRLNYDEAAPIRLVDVGGPEQERRCVSMRLRRVKERLLID